MVMTQQRQTTRLRSSLGRLSKSGYDFINEDQIQVLLGDKHDSVQIQDVLAKSLAKEPLSVAETAVLLAADRPDQIEAILHAAQQLKRDIYGNRIVLFAPLYVGSDCVNDCAYCAFRCSNREVARQTLSRVELSAQVKAMVDKGHKRCILVFGEHPRYDAEFIADSARAVYAIHSDRGEIRRININAAPLDHEGYKTVKAAGIGTYQIFQETYHHGTYAQVHPAGTRKSDYLWRLDGPARAIEAGCDDVGIGALFGLYDWRFEVLGLVSHAIHLKSHYDVGPHTISFPRLRPALGMQLDTTWTVDDEAFKRLVAILRLAVPYTGMILTAREPVAVRRDVIRLGVSQIDAGSRIELGGYTTASKTQQLEREQFQLGDLRSLDEVIGELIAEGYLPSFCTACYRLGRTGEHFMELAGPGTIKGKCTPNALLTLTEYLMDYASKSTREAGLILIEQELGRLPDNQGKQVLLDRLCQIQKADERDLYF